MFHHILTEAVGVDTIGLEAFDIETSAVKEIHGVFSCHVKVG